MPERQPDHRVKTVEGINSADTEAIILSPHSLTKMWLKRTKENYRVKNKEVSIAMFEDCTVNRVCGCFEITYFCKATVIFNEDCECY